MTLGNMRSLGVTRLDFTCRRCGRRNLVEADRLADEQSVPAAGARARCGACGGLGAECRPDWTQLVTSTKTHG
jgi:transcription elongation factor Elf1